MNFTKHTLLASALGLTTYCALFTSCSDTNTDRNQQLCAILPYGAQNMVKHMGIEVDTVLNLNDDGFYTVMFGNGVEVNFDEEGEWRKVNMHKKEVDNAVISKFLPNSAISYIEENEDGKSIRRIKRSRRNVYTVQLSGKDKLHFSKTGKFLPNDVKKLPSEAVGVLNKYFAGDSVVSATVDTDSEYDIDLASGISLEFDRMGRFDRIEAVKGVGVPESFLSYFPKMMVSYMNKNHADKKIRRIVRKNYGYFLKTDKPDAIELCFSKTGDYLRNANAGEDE